MTPPRLLVLILALLAASVARADYLFTYFIQNGADGLHLATSKDGYTWEKLNRGRSYLTPTVGISKLMRDPSVARGPDGTYHMVWTAGWTENDIGYASTRDFITWTEQKSIAVMAHEPTVRNTWAPEIVWDDQRQHFLIFWASTIPGKFSETANTSESGYNHRLYCTTTKDFQTFTPTRLFYDPGFSVIDATFLRTRAGLQLIVKDETVNPPRKHLQLAAAPSFEGPFGQLSAPFTPPGVWVEGPTAVQVGEDYVVYYDAYKDRHYGALRSRDLRTWEDVTARMHFPDEGTPQRMRHGTVIEVPAELVARLKAAGEIASAASVQIAPYAKIDLTRTDGGLLPARGAENIAVFRASRARTDLAEGKGYTYNHHPDLAVWQGRYYLAWDSGAKDEDTWPARELYSTSPDGRTWSDPQELFPEGVTTPMRLYFFLAPGGRMLAFAGLRLNHEETEEAAKGPLVVREIRADHTLGQVYTLRPPAPGRRPQDPPAYTEATDAGFVAACRELLAARVTLETQDYGVLLDPEQRSRWHTASAWPDGKLGNGFWKATTFYHRADGAIVGIGKAGWTSVSTDEGATWSRPVIPPTLHTNNAKVWGQRTGDGRYALVYNPTARPRYPLAIVTGDDGIAFGDMRTVQARFANQRYPGINKNTGLQYMRGIAEWATDGSIPDAKNAFWLSYSANKEDIWITRLPLPIGGATARPIWNTYQPKWATVRAIDATQVAIESREPDDCAEAVQLFAPTPRVSVSMTITTPPAGIGAVDVELMTGAGGGRPVRLRLVGDGFLRAGDRDKMVELGQFAPGTTLKLRLEAHCAPRAVFSVYVNDKLADEAQFAEPAAALERLAIRVWARADADRPTAFLPATATVGPEFDQPAAAVSCRMTDLKIEAR
ncbi:glycoside hydrolase family 43 protein [Opitutus sp. ER46]|uniref:glycoside hydrolase family 43 protein n=1 Tax=Opitutus sp. ER46 TaxID=2161864 RepID=UPI000D2FD1C4|nr:glycoside hydrolase family 43 protein [Opitutus sp. ER46]PTX92655.1 hypothetical protein DB354_15125 [Opitutus sp. ER46]